MHLSLCDRSPDEHHWQRVVENPSGTTGSPRAILGRKEQMAVSEREIQVAKNIGKYPEELAYDSLREQRGN